MISTATHHVTPAGAHVEVGAVTFQGRDFSALGSVIDHTRGAVMGYPSQDEKTLRTWDGVTLGRLRITGHARAVIDGFTYHGRGSGAGMLLRLRKGTS